MKLRKRGFTGTLSPEESRREKEHRVLIRRAAAESIVLLENDGTLPLKKGAKIALYGAGARYTVKGGTGSGSVNNRSNVTIDEGLRNAGFSITTDAWLDDYDQRYAAAREAWIAKIYELAGEPGDPEELYRAHASNPQAAPLGAPITPESKTDTDTAIYVISRISGEGADRKAEKGDYYLSDAEFDTLQEITAVYEKTIVVLNVGGVMDVSFMDKLHISALVYLSQAGMEGGNALADVLSGRVNPSGKLTDTWAYAYEDYPSSANFSHNNGNIIEEKYTDGIYVGYRYFDSFQVKPRYPFGYGLSYTTFAYETTDVTLEGKKASVSIRVKNTGTVPGREVIQLYAACPSGLRAKEQKRLVAFGKTGLLAPAAQETLCLEFDLSLLESYHTGKAAYYMEKGSYYLLAGTSAASVTMAARLTLEETVWTETLTNICPLLDALKEIQPSKERISLWEKAMEEESQKSQVPSLAMDAESLKREPLSDTPQEDFAEDLVKKLTLEQKATLVCGRPTWGSKEIIGAAAVSVPGAAGETTPSLEEEYGIGSIILADGPAGIRITAVYEENPEDGSLYGMTRYQSLENRFFGKEFRHEEAIPHYQYCSAIPVGTLLAQSFDLKLLEEVGELIGRELQEFGITLWLAPGMNIHRNPLCGRNFEYYSEDPLVSGMMAAALTLGVQKLPGIGTTIKHFACNNQEENRRGVSSIVSERALREIYLKGFEIAVKAAKPMAIMTSYNKINGVHTANSYDLCTTAARKEWGFTGIIMTDWTTTNTDGGSSAAKCIAAGNDLVMPGNLSDVQEICEAVRKENDQSLDEKDLDACAARMIRLILASNIYEDAESYLEGKELLPCMRQK
ncbi:MAG: glycoside hydrolase family 3 C-terminal domain-containing protein [Eubacteriales bacterium]|nr:glycoside hydrolase family 3 C-terminal domain-containing protein [Eubacteriales bacterium]